VPAGKAVGEALERLEKQWIDAGFPDDPRHLAKLIDAVASGTKQ
jgi:hypothetical protein